MPRPAYGSIADRVGAFLRRGRKLADIGDELPRDRIGRIGRIDEGRDIAG